ncbi:RagB/SusD family nutrient uptake outer membrane protein [Aureibacter tunicatorum]|uniref:RagB/SusD family nutrient uptake outer membrane protein n=1 Tax=Aureibacter tunicatorum TaxID=866807 RepID=A0AAE4BTA4_9BACT|nr:RagB/SusD family nutrient uptake outer membrane protein [Aureibacter tunicatorum]MDR6241989.1 hypothetical protein [Aureibacter tunicatorum]BDD07278.1 membrane protein [Aureibacter tunicatorum]
MKKFFKIFLVAWMSFSITSCDNYLDEMSPDLPTSDQIWVSYESAEKYLISAYAYTYTAGWMFHEYFYLPENFRADDLKAENGTTAWSYLARIVNFTNRADESVSRTLWTEWYKGIKLCNDIIENVPEMDMITEDQQNELVAEARFLRAFYHFNLQRNFHDIIVRDAVPKTPEELQKATSTIEEVYMFVEEDLKFATEHLPSSWPASKFGRATNAAANAYLGKTFLYQEKWSEAAEALGNVRGHSLVSGDRYRSLFDGTDEMSEEIIFSRQYTDDQMDLINQWHQLGVAFAPADLNGGWDMCSVSDYAMDQFDAGDMRKEATVLESGQEFDGEEITFNDPDRKMLIKYVEGLSNISSNRSFADVILMRYANVVLMRAEALNEMGQDGEAQSLINDIRGRAGLNPISFTGDQLRQEIRKQRLVELIGESERFYDLVRWDIVKEQLGMAQNPYADNFEEKHSFFPIPLEEVQRNRFVDPTPGF